MTNKEINRRKVICIYHSPCADGFAAAWVVRKYYKEKCDVTFIPASYGNAPPDVTDAHVIIVDFSYSHEVLVEMGKSAKSILVLDHHKTAEADLIGFLPPAKNMREYVAFPVGVQCRFNMYKSGAMIAWDFFFPDEQPPGLLEHIQDRDLWRFELPETKEIMQAVFSYKYDFEVWDHLMRMHVYDLELEGRALLRSHMKNIKEHIDRCATETRITLPKDKYGISEPMLKVPCLNAPGIWSSDAGHIMAENHPSKMAVIWCHTKNVAIVSLRSVEGGPDVSEIAKMHGGGGHKHAAGYTADIRTVALW